MRRLKKLAILLFFFFILFSLGIGAISYFYGDEIKAAVIENVNRQLKTKIDVRSVDFSIWHSFPKASVRFSDVLIYEVGSETDSLLFAESLAAEFNLIDLYQKNYRLSGLSIRDGKCHLKVNSEGKSNYLFWEESASETSKTTNFSSSLENVKIDRLQFSYADQTKKLSLHFLIETAELSGNFTASSFTMKINTTLKNSNLKMNETELLNGRTLFIYANGNVDQNEKNIIFSDANLGIDGMNLSVKGNYSFGRESKIDLHLQSQNAKLKKAIQLLPRKLKTNLERFSIGGNASFNGKIFGIVSARDQIAHQFDFTIQEGRFKDKKSSLILKDCYLKGNMKSENLNDLSTARLQLEKFSAKMKDGAFSGQLSIKNFKQPIYNLQAEVKMNLQTADDFFKWDEVSNLKGEVEASLTMEGRLKELGKYELSDWKRSTVQGKATLSEVQLKLPAAQLSFENINGSLNFTNNLLKSNDLSGNVNQNFLQLKGEMNNFIGFLANEKESLMIDALVYAEELNLDRFKKSPENKIDSPEAGVFEIPNRYRLYLGLDVETLFYENFQLTNFQSQLLLSQQKMDLRDIYFENEGGKFKGDIFIRQDQDRNISFSSGGEINQADIRNIFEKFDNFGQNTLEAEHISGKLSSTFNFSFQSNKHWEIESNSIKLEADLQIDQGILQNFKPVESLSKFIALEELKTIHFKQLKNQILINESTLFIPRFDVSSSAINLSMEGKHTFDNQIDYKFTVGLNEILGKKVKKTKENEFGYVEDEKNGGIKLFLKMFGTVENPIIKYDGNQLKKNIVKSFKKEKQTTKSILKEEFNLFKNDSSIKPLPQKEKAKNPFQLEYDESFSDSAKTTNIPQKKEKTTTSKSKFGKFLDKISRPNEEEYLEGKDE